MLLPLLLLAFASMCNGHKILVVIPKMGYSHMNYLGSIADTLVDGGHDVVSLQPLLFPHKSNGTQKSRLIQVDVDAEATRELLSNHHMDQEIMWTAGATNPFGVIGVRRGVQQALPFLAGITSSSVQHLLENKKLLDQLKAEKFDLGITELFDFTGMAIFEAIGLKNIIGAHAQSALFEGTAYAIGAPVIPSIMPASLGVTDDSPSITTRATNLFFTYLSYYFQTKLASAADNAMRKQLGSSATSIWDQVASMTWILTNSEPLLEYDKPTLNKVVHIGGIGVHKPKPLDREWDKILNLRKSTVLISFGSVAPSVSMPLEVKRAFIEVIKSFPDITFIWKYEKPDEAPFAKDVENLILSSWTPQSDLLADSRLTLFITHAGSSSMLESATYGKPLIVIPLFGDQSRNAKIVTKFGFGTHVNKASLYDSKVLRNAIETIIKDSKYTTAAHRVRRLLSKRPFTPEEKLLKTVDLAVEFGQIPELLVRGRNLSFITYHNLDIIAIILSTIAFVAFLFISCLRRLTSNRIADPKFKTQ